MKPDDILRIPVPPARTPTVFDRTEGKLILIKYENGSFLAMENDYGIIDHCELYKNKNEFESYYGPIDSSPSRSAVALAIEKADETVKAVYLFNL